MTDTLASDMTEKLGPLPVWVWGAIAAAVSIGGYYLYKRAHPGAAAADGTNASAADSSGAPVSSLYATSGIPAESLSVNSGGDISTWISRAANAVANAAGKSPSDVLAALQTWFNGGDITAAQKAYVDQAITLQGQPPELPVGISSVTPAPVATPTLVGYIHAPVGTISAIYSDHTRQDFTNYGAYQAFSKANPAPYSTVDNTLFNSYKVTGQNPTNPPLTATPGVPQ